MKKVLLATTVLALSTGFASAEIAHSGDARMGLVYDGTDTAFTSRARVKFSLSGETDGGLAFGASFRADNAVAAKDGQAGEVFISGAFGKLSMGDNDSAAQATIGHVAGVGLTGLGDLNEITYLSDGTQSVLYTYSAGALSFAASVGPLDADEYSVAVAYTMDAATFMVGYESNDSFSDDHIVLGAGASFGDLSMKLVYGMSDAVVADGSQYAVSATYAAGALTASVFHRSSFTDVTASGIGASYDLGGGASVVGGYAKEQGSDGVADIGLSFSF